MRIQPWRWQCTTQLFLKVYFPNCACRYGVYSLFLFFFSSTGSGGRSRWRVKMAFALTPFAFVFADAHARRAPSALFSQNPSICRQLVPFLCDEKKSVRHSHTVSVFFCDNGQNACVNPFFPRLKKKASVPLRFAALCEMTILRENDRSS